MALDREQIEARLEEANGGQPDLSGLDLAGADLSRLDLRGVDLSRADLSAADLRWAVLEGADLHSSVLRRADARWAVLRGANLRQADLARANLGWADLDEADLTGADMDGTSLESVDLSTVRMTRGAARSRPMRVPAGGAAAVALPGPSPLSLPGIGRPAWLDGISLPRVTPASVAIALLSVLGLLHVWGWLYRRSYYIAGWELDNVPGLVGFGQGENLIGGLTRILPLTIKALLGAPLLLLALAMLLGLVALPVLLLWLFGERVLADIARPQLRPVVVGGLFVAYTVIFMVFIIDGALDLAAWVRDNGMPGDQGLRSIAELFGSGGLLTKAGILVALALFGLPLWALWRWISHKVTHSELPLQWRMRYPALNSAAAYASESRIFRRNEPLSEEEIRRGLYGLLALILLLATLLTGTGRVQAFADMCDGGDLPRAQLFRGEPPPNVINATLCQRLLVETDDAYYVFFPSQTQARVEGQRARPEPNLRAIDKDDELTLRLATGETMDCNDCGAGPSGNEVFVVHPDERRVEGPLDALAGNLILLDLQAGPDVIDNIRIDDSTILTVEGEPVSNLDDLAAGLHVVAFGRLDPAQPNSILAREVNFLAPGAAGDEDLPPGEIQVELGDPWNPVFEGQGWQPDSRLEVRLVQTPEDGSFDADTPGNLLTEVTTGPDGSFSAPIALDPNVPTGPGYRILIVDPITGQTQVGPWLSQPAPTRTPVPTVPSPAPTREPTPTPEDGDPGEATETATAEPTEDPQAEATNTALPTPNNLPPSNIPGFEDCDQDAYEPNNRRGQQTVLYPTLSGDLEVQSHNFCPKGDIDLFMFQAKAGRHYRVRTLNLAPGVDTVMAVGDLSSGTGCQPWHPTFGCWSDDRNATSLDSEIIFEAIANDLVIVTVDNRGLRSGSEASYDIGVEQYEPGREVVTGTATLTPTPTRTRLPERDIYDNFASNNTCRTASEAAIETCSTLRATIGSSSDEDYYTTGLLAPGRYNFVLRPPDDVDYDMDIGIYDTSNRTPVCLRPSVDHQDGDRTETVPIEVMQPSVYYVRIYIRPGSREFTPYDFYSLTLECVFVPTAEPTATTAPSVTPITPTLTPTTTPTPPGSGLPATDTPTITPTVEPTPSPSPGS